MERTADPASSGSLSTSITHDPAVHESADQKDLVLDIMEQVSDQESASGRQSWASEEPHQTEEDDEGWMVTPLETLEARRRARVTADEEEGEAVDMEDVEASVREALRLLEDSDGLEDTGFRGEETDEEQWTEGRQDGYLDFVHEAMEAIWTVEDRERSWRTPEEAQEDLEQEEMEEEEEEEPVQTHSAEDMKQVQEDVVEKEDMKQIQEDAVREEDKQEDAQEEDDKQEQTDEQIHEEEQPQQQQEQVPEDEWQEAYTAKGRVYYYNRRTRESSWKMPSQYTASKSLPGNETVHDSEKDEKLHSSVLRQSLGYHPSASVSSVSTMERQTTLFCNFCGEQQPCDRLAAHFYECATAKFHKRRMSTLYSSFERALVLLSEDATLRSLHYATSFADPTPRARPGAATMQDNLLLLRPKSRRSDKS
ncbi:hypothetical protein PHYBOEH_011149 [Phytophthora boehmeriae]|uniref:WW domain-containing protein n=1 Tax=Phytophthora boehmeriae TaxID=109152 RepID=A0A8T1WX72_9STRA|nr:hypothetical protein PHYBOEH_011149 [Phytophthora boehmeriae]